MPIETTVYHIGAAGGVHRSWENYPGELRYVCFDAEEGAAAELQRIIDSKHYGDRVKMYSERRPVLDHSGVVDFNVYDQAMLSSVYRVDTDITHRFRNSKVRLLKTARMQCVTIDEIASDRKEAPDSLTIDAQGAGLLILKGAARALNSSLLGIRVEVEFLPLYVNQPLFDQVWAYMRGCGFKLVRLEKCGSGETGYSTDAGPFSGSFGDGVPAWADAIFLKTPAIAEWSRKTKEEQGSFLFKYVLFARYNAIGSLGLDFVFEIASKNLLEAAVETLCKSDRAILMRELFEQLQICETSSWEREPDRLAMFRRQQHALREMLHRCGTMTTQK